MGSTTKSRRNALYLLWWLAVAVVGVVIWGVYVLIAAPIFPGCNPDEFLGGAYYGGAASGGSLATAAVLGGSLWLVSGAAALRLRRKLGLLFLGFATLYVVSLVVLWNISPLFWGPRYCA
jgi:hypothetical protein